MTGSSRCHWIGPRDWRQLGRRPLQRSGDPLRAGGEPKADVSPFAPLLRIAEILRAEEIQREEASSRCLSFRHQDVVANRAQCPELVGGLGVIELPSGHGLQEENKLEE